MTPPRRIYTVYGPCDECSRHGPLRIDRLAEVSVCVGGCPPPDETNPGCAPPGEEHEQRDRANLARSPRPAHRELTQRDIDELIELLAELEEYSRLGEGGEYGCD